MRTKDHMIPAFRNAEGGLFSAVEKADVGSSYQEMEKQGVALMGWADPFMPDRSVPDHIQKALLDATASMATPHYTAPIGNMELKKKIAGKLSAKNRLNVDPNRNILITPGSDSGLYFAVLPFVHNGDDVLIPSPSYPNNFQDVRIMGGNPIPVLLKPENGYQLVKEDLEAAVTDRTKVLILTHPNNPTTTVYTRESLEVLREFILKYDLQLIVDQAFEDFTFENEYITPASMPDLFEKTVTVFSFSKGMGLSGLRVGYIVADDVIMDSMFACAVAVLGATNTACQQAMIQAMENTEFMEEYGKKFDFRRKKAYEIINSIPNVSMMMPESGFLCWVDVSKLPISSSEVVSYLTKNAKIAVNDGVNYGLGGDGHLRIVLGVYWDDQKIVDALERMKTALIELQK